MPRAPRADPDDIQRMEIRLPGELYAQIRDAAAEDLRSMNAEMVLRLRASFAPAKQATSKTRRQA